MTAGELAKAVIELAELAAFPAAVGVLSLYFKVDEKLKNLWRRWRNHRARKGDRHE